MSAKRLLESFAAWSESGQTLVLATVYETLGSTYSKAGHRILVAANGDYQGLVSGGCLEGDLAERARRVAATGEAITQSYDMRDEADDLWGLGVGCNGLLRVLLQPLAATRDYEPFRALADAMLGLESCRVATVVEPGRSDALLGGTVLVQAGRVRHFDVGADFAAALGDELRAGPGTTGLVAGPQESLVLHALLKPIPRLLVLGAGLDAVPLVEMASQLGWRVWIGDHRPAYIERGGFEAAERVLVVDPTKLQAAFDLASFDAIIVMSHHLLTDRAYLAELAAVDVAYLGVLGPPARKERLLGELGEAGRSLRPRLRGPVGLDIGADSPETIALSILAEIQARSAGYPRTS